MKKIILSLFLLIPLVAQAYDAYVGGIYYSLNTEAKTAEVTNGTSKYSGSVNIPSSITNNGVSYSVTSVGKYAFQYCTDLTSVTMPSTVTSVLNYGFKNCSSLSSVDFGGSVTRIAQSAFEGCSSLTTVSLPGSLTTLGSCAFYNCSKLATIVVPSSVSSIGDQAFGGTSWYNSQPDGMVYAGLVAYKYKGTMEHGTHVDLKSGCVGIAGSAFNGCTRLKSISVPNSVVCIGAMAFNDCTTLEAISIPSGVTRIESYTFYNCVKLQEIRCNSKTPPTCGTDAFKSVNSSICVVYVPAGSKKDYASASGWSGFSNIVEEGGSGDSEKEELQAAYDNLLIENAKLQAELSYLRLGDLNKDGRTDIGDVATLIGLYCYLSDNSALAELTNGSSISVAEIEQKFGEVEFYTTNGTKVSAPTTPGIYVVKQKGVTKMVVIKK